jgi:hypothetical protein
MNIGAKYILKGHEVVVTYDIIEWVLWMEKADRRVKNTYVGDVQISTVFIGLDFNFWYMNGTPKLFETMVFGGAKDKYVQRYTTWEEAECGHSIVVEEVKRSFTYIMQVKNGIL